LSIIIQIPWLILCLAAFLCAAISYFVYRYTVPPVGRGRRLTLSGLRGVALTLIVFAMCEPLFRFTRSSTLKPVIAVLMDNSLSMSLTDDNGNREQMARSLISDNSLKELSGAARFDFFSISPSLHAINKDSLRFNGATTDIASALHDLNNASLPQLKAVILVSDGEFNSGENPLYEAEGFGLPIFTVGIGDSLDQRDVAIQKLATNSVAYMQSSVPVDATVKISGYENRKIPVTLSEEGRVIGRQEITVPPSAKGRTGEYAVHFSFVPTTAGVKKYSVSIPTQGGEVTGKNNTRSAIIKILKNKMQVFVVAGAPSPDVAAVMQALHADPNIQATLAVQRPDGLFAQKQLSNFEALSSADCIVLVGFPTETSTESSVGSIIQPLRSKGIPLLFVMSRTLSLSKLRRLDSFLPFNVTGDVIDEQTVFPNIAPLEQNNVLVQAGENVLFDWSKLPPVYSSLGVFAAKPEAITLATTKIQGVAINNPLLVARNILHSKTFAILGYGVWRWKLLAGASPETENFFDPWMSNVVRWLVTRDDDQHVRINTSKEVFSQGEPIDFLGQVYDDDYRPVDNAEVRVDIVSLSTKQHFEIILHLLDNGRYEGQAETLPEGEYAFHASAKTGGIELGKTEGRFSVGEESIEFFDTKMNKPLLQQIASVSGGKYADGDQFPALVHDIEKLPLMKPERQLATNEFELWNLPLLLSVIVALFGVEWFVRKRSGML